MKLPVLALSPTNGLRSRYLPLKGIIKAKLWLSEVERSFVGIVEGILEQRKHKVMKESGVSESSKPFHQEGCDEGSE